MLAVGRRAMVTAAIVLIAGGAPALLPSAALVVNFWTATLAAVSPQELTGEAARAQPPRAPSGPADEQDVAEGHTTEGAHEPGIWSLIARLANFGILVGALVYLLRSPFAQYVKDRATRIRQDLVAAAELRSSATRQLEEIDRKVKALPGEVAQLKARGAEEIAAEEKRILQAADAERERLLDQTRREIDLQLRVARRELVAHAAELAVGVAEDRIKRTITNADHARLVDRYVAQVRQGE